MKTYALSILLWVACSVTAAAAPTVPVSALPPRVSQLPFTGKSRDVAARTAMRRRNIQC